VATKDRHHQEVYYFSERLKKQLTKIHQYPLTILEAPSGFGKTTAIREHFKEDTYQSMPVYWHTCLKESSLKTWQGVCDILGSIDSHAAMMLRNLDFQTVDARMDLVAIFKLMKCEVSTYVIIDNFQMIDSDITHILIQSFSIHAVENLHIILLTQQLGMQEEQSFHNGKIYVMDASCFLFDRESIVRYFRLAGVRIKDDDIEHIHKHAAGWAIAVHLHLIRYQEKGSFIQTSDIWDLIESTMWHNIQPEERDFLMSVSVLDSFTTRQAAVLFGEKSLPKGILKLLSNNTFIRYLHVAGVYSIHSILLEFLRNQFHISHDGDYQKRMIQRAAQSCVAHSDYYHAIELSLKIEDYEAILALPLQDDYFNYDLERYIMDWIVLVVNQCPIETLVKYPMSLITFALQFMLYGRYESFGYLCEVIASVFENPGELSVNELRSLQGEMTFVQSFTAYNDIEKMVEHYQSAYALLGKPSRFTVVEGAWTFGGVSVLYMFWNKTGTLESTMACLDANFSYYTRLTHGHGTGGASIMRAEAMLMQGNDLDAEALCHKGLYLARRKGQTSICLSAELVLARIALLRGDAEDYQNAIDSIAKYLISPSSDWQIKRMVDLCNAALTAVTAENKSLPDWMWKMDGPEQEMYAVIQPYCHILYGKHLLINKRYAEIYGLSSPYLNMAEEMNYLLPQVYQFIYLAIAKNAQGKTDKAEEYLGRALSKALPDEVYLPFAENAPEILPMLEAWGYLVPDTKQLNTITALCKRHAEGVHSIRKSFIKIKTVLTPRETELARLTKEGNSVKAIAEMLYISDATVKTILKSVYSKLGIHSKGELGKIDL